MTTSDSEDFESADEGHTQFEKKERKKRTSSSNYSESEVGPKEIEKSASKDQKLEPASEKKKEGWDDFDIDTPIEDDTPGKSSKETKPAVTVTTTIKTEVNTKKDEVNTQDTGWDDFDDWGQDDANDAAKMPSSKPSQSPQTDADIKVVTDKLAEASTKSNAWGWGWGMDSLLSTATAGISTLTSQVSQGISTVLETSIGAPDPEELARRNIKESETKDINVKSSSEVNPDTTPAKVEQPVSNEASFQFGSLFSGVTKFVESTGTKVIAGGLDTLETIGKKTMEVLQDGDPGLVKKRAMLGLDAGDKPVLSQILREAKAKADEEDKIKEEKREAKEVHYENLFDDFEGLVHLEALEMLSKQVSMRIEERLRGVEPEKRQDIKETLQQVQELCEIPEDEDEDEDPPSDQPKPDALAERLQVATQDLGLKLQFQPLVKQYKDVLTWLSSEDIVTDKAIYKRAVSSLAQATALAVEVYHKTAEMLLVKTRRSTADEADALTQMTVVLTKHVSELATLFTVKLNSLAADNKDQINNYITNIFLESGNSSTYIQNAFQLALPILQIGAV